MQPALPLMLKTNYLVVLCEAYFVTERKCRDVEECDGLPSLVASLADEVGTFVEDVLPTTSFTEDEDLKEAQYMVGVVLPTLTAFYRTHYSREWMGDADPGAEFAAHLNDLYEAAISQPDLLDPEV